MFLDPAVGDRINVVDLRKEVESVGDEDLGLTLGVVRENLLERRLSDMGVRSGEGVLNPFRRSLAENGSKRHSRQKSECRHRNR